MATEPRKRILVVDDEPLIIEVLKDIKKIDETIPVIMVTANEQIALAADALKTGAFGYVPKPFDFRYLDHMVAAIFDRPRPAR